MGDQQKQGQAPNPYGLVNVGPQSMSQVVPPGGGIMPQIMSTQQPIGPMPPPMSPIGMAPQAGTSAPYGPMFFAPQPQGMSGMMSPQPPGQPMMAPMQFNPNMMMTQPMVQQMMIQQPGQQPMMMPVAFMPAPMMPGAADGGMDQRDQRSASRLSMYQPVIMGWPGGPMMPMSMGQPAPSVKAESDYADVQPIGGTPDLVASKPVEIGSSSQENRTQVKPDVIKGSDEPMYMNEAEIREEPRYMNSGTKDDMDLNQPTYANENPYDIPSYANEPSRFPRGASLPPMFCDELADSLGIGSGGPVPPPRSRRSSMLSLNKSTHSLNFAGLSETASKLQQTIADLKSQHPTTTSKANPKRPPRRKDRFKKKSTAGFSTLPRNFKSNDLGSISEDLKTSTDLSRPTVPMPGTRPTTPASTLALSEENLLAVAKPVVEMPSGSVHPEKSPSLTCVSPVVPMPGTQSSNASQILTTPSDPSTPLTVRHPKIPMPGTGFDAEIIISPPNVRQPDPTVTNRVSVISTNTFHSALDPPPINNSSAKEKDILKTPEVMREEEEKNTEIKISHEYEDVDFNNDGELEQVTKGVLQIKVDDDFQLQTGTKSSKKKGKRRRKRSDNKRTSSHARVPPPEKSEKIDEKDHDYDDIEFATDRKSRMDEKPTIPMPNPAVIKTVLQDSSGRDPDYEDVDMILKPQPIEPTLPSTLLTVPKTDSSKESSVNSIEAKGKELLDDIRQMDSTIQNLKIGMIKVYEDVYAKPLYAKPNKIKRGKSMDAIKVEEVTVKAKQTDKGDYEQVEVKEGNMTSTSNDDSKREDDQEEQNIVEVREQISKDFRANFFGIHQDEEETDFEEIAAPEQEQNKLKDSDAEARNQIAMEVTSDPGTETLDVTIDIPGLTRAEAPRSDDEQEMPEEFLLDEALANGGDVEVVEDMFDWDKIAMDAGDAPTNVVIQDRLK